MEITPSELMFSWKPHLSLLTILRQTDKYNSYNEWQNRLKYIRDTANEYDQQIKQERNETWNEWHKLTCYLPGDLVWFRVETREKKKSKKLTLKWMGPYKVTGVINNTIYWLKHILNEKRNTKGHASRLKPYIADVAIQPKEMTEYDPGQSRLKVSGKMGWMDC